MAKIETTEFILVTSSGILNRIKFGDYDDNPEIGREKAFVAARRMADAWMRNAPQCLPEDNQVNILEK